MIDIKELKKLVKFLRDNGITEYCDGPLMLKLTPDAPTKAPKKTKKQVEVTKEVEIPTDFPTQEQLLFMSADPSVAAEIMGTKNADS